MGDIADAELPRWASGARRALGNALDRPPTVAKGVLGKAGDFDRLPFFYSDQYDLGLEYSGRGGREDDIVIRGDLAGREYRLLARRRPRHPRA